MAARGEGVRSGSDLQLVLHLSFHPGFLFENVANTKAIAGIEFG